MVSKLSHTNDFIGKNLKNSFLGIGILALANWAVANYYGLGLTHDSFYYLRLYRELDVAILRPQSAYPLAIYQFDPFQLQAALIINLLSFAVTLASWAYLLSNSSLNAYSKLITFSFIALSIPLLLVSSFLWTEISYLMITSICFVAFWKWKAGDGLIWLILFLIGIILSIWARKIGVIFCASAILVFTIESLRSYKLKWLVSCIYIVVMLVFWVSYFPGEKPSSQYVYQNFNFNINAMINWFLPASLNDFIRYSFILSVLILLIFRPIDNTLTMLIVVYFILYFLVRLPIDREFAEESDRYFAVLFPAAIFQLAHSLQPITDRFNSLKKIIVPLTLILLGLGLIRSINNTANWYKNRKNTTKTEQKEITYHHSNQSAEITIKPYLCGFKH